MALLAQSPTEINLLANLRRRANKLGYRIMSSRRELNTVSNQGGYQIVYIWTNTVIDGANYELALDRVHEWINDAERAAA